MPYEKVKKEDLFQMAAENMKDTKVAFDYAVEEMKVLSQHLKNGLGPEMVAEPPAELAVFLEEVMAEEIVEEEIVEDYGFKAKRQEEMLVWYPRNNGGGDGYADNTCVLEPIRHYNIKDLLARFFITSHASWGMINNWRQNVIGITSYYFGAVSATKPGGAHMPMFDYDGKNVKTQIRKDVKLIQKEFGLGNAWVYETRRGFHIYFFTDVVSRDEYWEMLEKVQCCKGFKRAAQNRGYAVLRVGAKYTDYDIRPLYVLAAKDDKLRRMTRKAHTIRALIDLGIECGTHFACMFPQWAHFKQDPREWKSSGKKPTAKRIKKVAKPYKLVEQPIYVGTASTSARNTATFTITNATNTWITTGNTGGGTGETNGF